MALFGFQLCYTLIVASFLQKIVPLYSFGRWLICNGSLVRYKHPTDDELRKLSKKPAQSDKSNKSRYRKNKHNADASGDSKTFKVPKNLEIVLDTETVQPVDCIVLRNFPEYEWLVNYTLCVLLVYIGTEIYYEVWNPSSDFNISLVWISLAIGFAVKDMLSILWLYAKAQAGGELSMSIAFGMFSFVISLGILMLDEEFLEFGLSNETLGLNFGSKASLRSIKLILAAFSAFYGIILAFPAFRMAQMYLDALKFSTSNVILNTILHVNFCAPFVASILWIKPISRDFLTIENNVTGTLTGPFITDSQYDLGRIVLVISICVLRLALFRTHLQAYLNKAYHKLAELRKEAGYITNVELQRSVAQIFYYLGVVSMQYLSPLVILLSFALVLKTSGGYSWLELYESNATTADSMLAINDTKEELVELDYNSSVNEMVSSIDVSLHSLHKVFTPLMFRGIFSYAVWWSAFNWFLASCLGILYHSYLSS